MRIEELKKGFWGFQKDGVFRFIAQQEEAFAQKLAEKDAQMERRSQQDQERIQRLEEENRQLQAELEQADRLFNRYRADSELSRVNAGAGKGPVRTEPNRAF